MLIYFLGIGGSAMGNVALLCRELGHEVVGADEDVYPPMSTVLAKANIRVYNGYSEERLRQLNPHLVVVGNALSRGNPEIEWLLEKQTVKYVSLPELLRNEILSYRRNIVVAGTHGKTTTATLAAYLLEANSCDPGYLIGGIPRDLPAGSRLGDKAAPFVIEGDEYDSAFFDKRSKFIHYLPSILIINNLEFDHVDIFRDLADVKRAFRHLVRLVPRNGYILANGDDPNIREFLPVPWTSVITVGVGAGNDLRIDEFSETAEGTSFSLLWHEDLWVTVNWRLHGLYNARNAAMAVLAAGVALNARVPETIDVSALDSFTGVKRRQEVLYEADNLLVIEDFGHHPTAVRDTLDSLRARYPREHLIACFEPRSNTSRSSVFQNEISEALARADGVFLGPVHRSDKLTAAQRLDVARICLELSSREQQVPAYGFATNEELLEAAWENYRHGLGRGRQIYCFFSNGSFDRVMDTFAARAREQAQTS